MFEFGLIIRVEFDNFALRKLGWVSKDSRPQTKTSKKLLLAQPSKLFFPGNRWWQLVLTFAEIAQSNQQKKILTSRWVEINIFLVDFSKSKHIICQCWNLNRNRENTESITRQPGRSYLNSFLLKFCLICFENILNWEKKVPSTGANWDRSFNHVRAQYFDFSGWFRIEQTRTNKICTSISKFKTFKCFKNCCPYSDFSPDSPQMTVHQMLYSFQRLELYYPAPLYRYVEYKTFTKIWTSIGNNTPHINEYWRLKCLHQHYHTTTFSSNLFYRNFNQNSNRDEKHVKTCYFSCNLTCLNEQKNTKVVEIRKLFAVSFR